MAMAVAMAVTMEESVRISFGVYKPTDGHDIDDVVSNLRTIISSAQRAANLRALILKSVNASWVAVFCISNMSVNRMEEDDDVMRVVEWGSFVIITVEQKQKKKKKHKHKQKENYWVSVGDIVSVRRIYTEWENQEVIAYSCVAVLKAYFAEIEGLLSCAFYKSKDGMRVLGLGKWDSAASASAFLDSRGGSPGEVYWKDLGAFNLKYEVCQVVYTTMDNFNFVLT